jgi:hypothetical protein
MTNAKLRKILMSAEMLVGLIAILVSLYFIVDVSNCNPGADFCKPLGMVPVLVFLVPGCLMAAAGFLCYSPRRFSVRAVQSALIALLIFYYGLLLATVLVLSS